MTDNIKRHYQTEGGDEPVERRLSQMARDVNKALTGREDRTPLKTIITTHDEAVFIEFNRPTLNMGMTAADTLTFAEGLIKAARSLGATRKIED